MTPDVLAALKSCVGILLPSADQSPDGSLEVTMGAKGVVELELVSSGEAVLKTYRKLGVKPQVLPRSPGSWPGYRFTNPPLSLAAGGFGLGHGTGAHAPDEYYLVESANPKVQGLDGAVASFVEVLYALA
jgi:hypothetical protein